MNILPPTLVPQRWLVAMARGEADPLGDDNQKGKSKGKGKGMSRQLDKPNDTVYLKGSVPISVYGFGFWKVL